jgi:type II secretory pathway pseudopilin PulG
MAFRQWRIGNNGFSLIEVSILIVILSLLLTSIVGFSSTTENQEAIDITKKHLDVIEKAMIAHQNLNGHLPCPAELDNGVTDSAFGQGSSCSSGTSGALFDYGTGSEGVRVGMVPTLNLGISKKYALDGWNNKITYAVIKDLARTDALFDAYNPGSDHVISVLDMSNNEIGQDNPSQIAYALISHGKNGNGSYNSVGSNNLACVTTVNDGENCDADAIFRKQKSDNGSANYYDDLVRYKTYQVVKKKGGYKTWGSGSEIKYGLFYDRKTSGNQDSPSTGILTNLGFGTSIGNTTNTVAHNTNFGGTVTPTSDYGKYLIRHSSVGCDVDNFHGTSYESVTTNRGPGQAVFSDAAHAEENCTKSDSTYYGNLNATQDIRAELYTQSISSPDGRGKDPVSGFYYFHDSYEVWELDR